MRNTILEKKKVDNKGQTYAFVHFLINKKMSVSITYWMLINGIGRQQKPGIL